MKKMSVGSTLAAETFERPWLTTPRAIRLIGTVFLLLVVVGIAMARNNERKSADSETAPDSVAGSPNTSGPVPLERSTVRIDSGRSIRIGTLWKIGSAILSLVVATSAITWGVQRSVVTKPLSEEHARLKGEFEKSSDREQRWRIQAEKLEFALDQLSQQQQSPMLVAPRKAAIVTGNHITLEWKYRDHDQLSQSYALEIVHLSPSEVSSRVLEVANPQRQLMHLDNLAHLNGHNIWRVRPGPARQGHDFDHLWSSYQEFFLYSSPLEKVRETGILAVGITPLSVAQFVFKDSAGNHTGFDVDLIEWIAEKLSKRLAVQVSVRFVDVPWDKILSSVENHTVDVAIGSITRTAHREGGYPRMAFTDGYLQTNQVFIQKRRLGAFPESLEGKKVGVSQGTTNEYAAEYLKEQLGFEVNSSYEYYADVYKGLEDGEIDFALVDDVLVKHYLRDRFVQFGPELTHMLTDFYRERHGQEREEYAIAAPRFSDGNESLLTLMNTILGSTEGKSIIEALKKKWLRDPGESKDLPEVQSGG